MEATKTNTGSKTQSMTAPKRNPAKSKRPAQTEPSATTKVAPQTITPKDVDPTQYVTVRNGFQGRLVYVSKRTGEKFIWDSFGDEQDMELRELKNAKNSYKKFFENNWFMFDEDWIVDYLGVRNFYKNAVRVEDFDHIFTKTPEEVREIVGAMSKGQKKSISYRARVLISEGKIDSLNVITTLEDCLGIDLIER